MGKIIFITGTDTGVGKTVATGLLLHHLREKKIQALAMKPFCTGDRKDVEFLQKLQPAAISNSEMNPYFFPEPIAPFIAAQIHRKRIQLDDVLGKIFAIEKQCDVLLIEGAGGLMVPLGENFMIRDLIHELKCSVVLVSANKLGTINHTILSVLALQSSDYQKLAVLMVEPKNPDAAVPFNEEFLKMEIHPTRVFSMPYVPQISQGGPLFKKSCRNLQKTLAAIIDCI